ncbi:MAG: RNA degradosome polyphosphate kinase, partial [Bryobacteraceae bacterium]|nr:RNA degradosome polyphosphate kinase [Bryobacteraceae bacterium]
MASSTRSPRKRIRARAAAPAVNGAAHRDGAAAPKETRYLFLNREISLLEFQRRVLQEASDPKTPLLERIKFLSIVGSNLDELFMVRVTGLKEQMAAGILEVGPDGMTPAEQLAEVRSRVASLMADCHRLLRDELIPALARHGVSVVAYAALEEAQRARANDYFREIVFP